MQDFNDKSPPALQPSPDGRGTLKVSIYPKVSGSISDAQVQAEPENRWSSESRAKRLAA